ncbi:orexin receptor type 2-like [Dermatophagoides pteronyssinus]
MLIIIIGVFTICWLPIQLFNILIYFKSNFLRVDSEFKYYAFVGSYFFCHWISMAHSFMNPIIYSFMSKNFRSDMKMIFANIYHYCRWINNLNQHSINNNDNDDKKNKMKRKLNNNNMDKKQGIIINNL